MIEMTVYKLKRPKAATATDAYNSVEKGVVGTYKKIEDGVVGAYKKIEGRFIDAFLEEVPVSEEQTTEQHDGQADEVTTQQKTEAEEPSSTFVA
jgi:hypothetical protein